MREKAMELLKEYNESESLIRHALCVEGIMRYFAEEAGEDVEYWGAVGLLHDLDYEKYPEEHCAKTKEILEANGYEEDFIRGIMSHGYGIVTDVKPERYMEKVLFTIDELSGLIVATALMRPSKSVTDLEVKSVKKKFKDKGFAGGVDRGVIKSGCEMLGMDLGEVMEKSIQALRLIHEEIDL